MRKKLVVSTLLIANKLRMAQRCLSDCTEDILIFSRFLASRLDPTKKPEMRPWGFAEAWNGAINAAIDLRHTIGPLQEPMHSMQHMPYDRLQVIARMMPVFAEDLCGKEFAEVADMCKEDGVGRTKSSPSQQAPLPDPHFHRFPFDAILVDENTAGHSRGVAHELAYLQELREKTDREIPAGCHPFPPGDPMMVEEAKKCINRYPGYSNLADAGLDGFSDEEE